MPGLIGAAKAGVKLQSFLTPRNLQYLDVLLRVVTTEGSSAFASVWRAFQAYFPSFPGASQEALGRLRSLHQIVQEYMRG